MALKAKIDKATYDALPDAVKAEYKPDGEGFKLDLDDTEIAAEMRRARDREKQRADDAEAARVEAERKLSEVEGNDARKRGDLDSIERSWKDKLTKAETDAKGREDKLKSQLSTLLVTDKAREIAQEISTAPAVLLPHIVAKLTADLEGETPTTRVLGDDGKPTALTLDDLKKSFVDSKDFAPIIIGSKATGSGGAGGNQGGGASKQPSEYTEAERIELFRRDRAEFNRLFPQAT